MLVIKVESTDGPVMLDTLFKAMLGYGDAGVGIASFLNFVSAACNLVTPDMGPDEVGEYEGQPIVWDGYWDWRRDNNPENVKGGNMYYCGNEWPSGQGRLVERLVKPDDLILFT